MVASIDDNVGRLLDWLDEQGLAEDTVVVYTSDQGFFLGDHGWYDKRFMYEESLRMPLIMRCPRGIAAGSVSADMVLNVDFAPTFLDLAGVAPDFRMQGRSFAPVLAGETPSDWRTSFYYRYWMHRSHHNVFAHYGVPHASLQTHLLLRRRPRPFRQRRRTARAPNGNSSTCRTTRPSCTTASTIRPWPTPSPR